MPFHLIYQDAGIARETKARTLVSALSTGHYAYCPGLGGGRECRAHVAETSVMYHMPVAEGVASV